MLALVLLSPDPTTSSPQLFVGGFLVVVVGALLGFLGGFMAGHPFLGALIGGVTVFVLVNLMVGGAGRAAGTLHNPSGRTTPREKEYSAAEALVVVALVLVVDVVVEVLVVGSVVLVDVVGTSVVVVGAAVVEVVVEVVVASSEYSTYRTGDHPYAG